ncbi:MAG TPA: MEKHLA domain-containing protein [Methylophilaceae bacterium]
MDLLKHVALLRFSFQRQTGRELLRTIVAPESAVLQLQQAPFAVVSHGMEADPIFNYANQTALGLFEMEWEEFIRLPSRLSAEAMERNERERLLQRVTEHGFVDDYSGIRISSCGRRFLVKDATVWNLVDENGLYQGQAALLKHWQFL